MFRVGIFSLSLLAAGASNCFKLADPKDDQVSSKSIGLRHVGAHDLGVPKPMNSSKEISTEDDKKLMNH